MAWRDGLKSQQVWEHRHGRRAVLKKIAMSDLPVSVTIRRIRELERDERLLGSVVTAIACQYLPAHLRSDERRQEFLQNGSLIVPAQLAGGVSEHVCVRNTAQACGIDESVVRPGEREMHLRHEDVRIVPWVADDCRSLSVSLDVIRIRGQQ